MTRKDVTGALRSACICQLADFAVCIQRGISKFFSKDQSTQRVAAVSLPMEALEGRQLLAGVTFADGVLTVSGADGRTNSLTVSLSGSNYVAKSNSASKTVAKSS